MSTYNEYFKYEGSHVVDNVEYKVYQPYGFPLILKAQSGRVLATLQVFFDDALIYNQNYPIPVPFEGGFQIIFQSDDSIDNGRPIKYVITQHCKEANLIKFDIGFNKIPSCVTDPPENINNVNELHPFEPFAIKSNQLNGWKELIVKTKKKINSDNTTSSVSLDEESKAEPNEKVGTYLYLTVCPQQNKELSELFKDAQWHTEDTIIIEKNDTRWENVTHNSFPSGIIATRGNIMRAAENFNYYENALMPGPVAFAPHEHVGIKSTGLVKSARQVQVQVQTPFTTPTELLPTLTSAAFTPRANAPIVDSPAPILAAQKVSAPVACSAYLDDLDCPEAWQTSDNVSPLLASAPRKPELLESATILEATETINKTIMSSKVAEMTGGQRIICQSGNMTNVEYDYEVRTAPRKIGLSIMDLKITKIYSEFTPDEIKAMVMTYLEEIKKLKDRELISSFAKNCKIYKSDVCTVCLGDVPNIVLIRCGHICTCSDDCTDILKNKCPICRENIICKITESVFNSNC